MFVLIREFISSELPAGILLLHAIVLMLLGVMMVLPMVNFSDGFCVVVHVSLLCAWAVFVVLVLAEHKFNPLFLLGCDLSTQVPDHMQS